MSRGVVTTFYSYKGGVGRTFILANVAVLMARWGRRVLCVDWDLEAPGLQHYFAERIKGEAGDGIAEIVARLGRGEPAAWKEAVRAVGVLHPSSAQPRSAPRGCLDFLNAGRLDDGYAERLRDLDWNQLYRNGIGRRLEQLRDEWADAYDVVLIDSRTGVTDSGGICTVQLPDIVVFVVTANAQSLEGATKHMKKAAEARRRLPVDRPGLLFLPLPARFDGRDEVRIANGWLDRFASAFAPFYEPWSDKGVEPRRLLDLLCVPYQTLWSFGEPLPVLTERLTDPKSVSYALVTVAALLLRGLEDSSALVESRDDFVSTAEGLRFDVFLTHGGSDRARADAITTELVRRGLRVWRDVEQLDVRSDWMAQIERGLVGSSALVWLVGGDAIPMHEMAVTRFREGGAARPVLLITMPRKAGERVLAAVAGDVVIDGSSLSPAQIVDAIERCLPREGAPSIGASTGAPSVTTLTTVTTVTPAPARDRPATPVAALRAHQARLHRDVVPFFKGAGDRVLEAMFVELDLAPDRSADRPSAKDSQRSDDRKRADVADHGRQLSLEDLLAGRAEPSPRPSAAPRWIVVGDPGAGKTTLARNLCRSFSERTDRPLPIYVSLARWAEFDGDPFAFVEGDLRQAAPESPPGLADELRRGAAESSDVWLLLDGLDEVAPQHLDATCVRIEELAARWPRTPIAVFSRPVVVERRSLGTMFSAARVRPLDEERQKKLLIKLLGVQDADHLWMELAPHPTLREMAQSPLLLTLIGVVGRDALNDGRPLPTRRGRLFSVAVDLVLRRGFASEPHEVRDREAARVILRLLSLRLQESGGEAWTREQLSEILDALRQTDARVNFALKETWATNAKFLDDIGQNAGVLGPHDGPREPWRYLHRSFREYLAAEALRDLMKTGGEAAVAPYLDLASVALKERDEAKKERTPSTRLAAAEPQADPVDRYAARWGEVWGLLATMIEKPESVLAKLGAASGEILRRILPAVDGLAPERGVALVLGTKDFEYGHLWSLTQSWGVSSEQAAEALWTGVPLAAQIIGPERKIEVLSYLHYALERVLGPERSPPDRERFFREAGLPPPPKKGVPGLEFVAIPAGRFLMGSPENEVGRYDREGPQHAVTVAAFRLAATPVTESQYALFDEAHKKSAVGDQDVLPATGVSWWQARLYCQWISGSLPTEAQWEYACRAGTTTRFWSGDADEDLERVGWFDKNSGNRSHAVAKKPANPWGLFDMPGNVWEWCADWLGDYPKDGGALQDPVGPPSGSARVLRGGSCWDVAGRCRSAFRYGDDPSVRGFSAGFRVALPAAPVAR